MIKKSELPLELVRPDTQYRDSFLAALAELPESERQPLLYHDPWTLEQVTDHFAEYVSYLLRLETDPPAPLVPDTVLWAVSGDRFVGRISIRHELNEYLRNVAGHIGYGVRLSERGKGFATRMLAHALLHPVAQRIGRVLVTCDDGNLPSIRTIERNGGKLSGSYQAPGESRLTLHYWIDSSAPRA